MSRAEEGQALVSLPSQVCGSKKARWHSEACPQSSLDRLAAQRERGEARGL